MAEWEKIEIIGKGTFGTVYKVKRESNGYTQYSALKEIHLDSNSDFIFDEKEYNSIEEYNSHLASSIMSEVKTMNNVKGQTNIVNYEDHEAVCDENGNWTISIRMELLTPLKDYLKDHQLSQNDVIKIGRDLCNALEICEKNNIIHRDIKIENIFVNDNGDIKLGDFGTAKVLSNVQTHYTSTGTISYMAPEVLLGSNYDFRADQYSLAVLLYYLLNDRKMPQKHNGEITTDPQNADKTVSRIILKACSRNKEDRFEKISDFRNALIGLSANKTGFRKPIIIIAVALVVVLAIVSAILGRDYLTKKTGDNQKDEEIYEIADKGLFNYSFVLENVKYQLPADFSELVDAGWYISDNMVSEKKYVAGELTTLSFKMAKDGKGIEVTVYNPSEDARQVKDCKVVGIQVYANSGIQFSIADEITCLSPVTEIIEKLGEPSEKEVKDQYTHLAYYETEQHTKGIEFACYKETASSYIVIKNYSIYDKVEKTYVDEKVPEYLSDYRPPISLGTDLQSGIVQIEGVLYKMPAPLKVFIDNGWIVNESPESVSAGQSISVLLRKDSSSIEAEVTNFSLTKELTENCVVTYILIDELCKTECVLPGEIGFETDKGDFIKAMSKSNIDVDKSLASSSFTVSDWDVGGNYCLDIRFDSENGLINSIMIDTKPLNPNDCLTADVFK